MEKPDYLVELLELWNERPPFHYDIAMNSYEMFHVPHFYHVVQGQKLFNPKMASAMLKSFDLEERAKYAAYDVKLKQSDHERIDHAESLREIQI
jgi:hypothetical protein